VVLVAGSGTINKKITRSFSFGKKLMYGLFEKGEIYVGKRGEFPFIL